MAVRKFAFITTSMMALMVAPAMADVTAQDVWDDIQVQMESSGYDFAVENIEQKKSGLLLAGARVSIEDEGAQIDVDLGDIHLDEIGNGQVRITHSDKIAGVFNTDGSTSPLSGDFTIKSQNSKTLAHGNPGEVTYEYKADRSKITVTGVLAGEDGGSLSADIDLSSVIGSNLMVNDGNEVVSVKSNMLIGDANVRVRFASDERHGDGEGHRANIRISDLNVSQDIVGAADLIESFSSAGGNPAEHMKGLQAEQVVSYGGVEFGFSLDEGDSSHSMAVTGKTGRGGSAFKLNEGGVSISSSSIETHVDLVKLPAPMPPMTLTLAEISTGLEFPFPPLGENAETERDAELKLVIRDLDIDKALWGMLDPNDLFDHAPLTFELDADAAATLASNLKDPLSALSASLNVLKIKALGVDAMASGSVDFKNLEEMASFDVTPVGSILVKIAGMDDFLSAASETGFAPDQVLQMTGMMLGIYTKVDEDGSRTAVINFTDDGSITINGSPVK